MSIADSAAIGDKPCVLVADDSRVMHKAIAKILKDEAELIEAHDGEEAWEALLANGRIQVLITDIEMPRLDGYSLICRVRAYEHAPLRHVPIITITGADDEATKARAYACGATDFITKPLDALQLLARVRAHASFGETSRQLVETTATLAEESTADALTSLSSRRFFMQRGEQDLAYSERHHKDLSLIRVDLDSFKKLYRQYGDEVANEMLICTAKILARVARREDTVARIGGAEFAILAPATCMTEAMVLCERLRQTIDQTTLKHAGETIPLTASFGLVTHSAEQPHDSLAAMLDLANERLRAAKAEGGNCISVNLRGEEFAAPDEVELAEPVIEETVRSSTPVSDYEVQQDTLAQPALDTTPATLPPELIDIDQVLRLLAAGQRDMVEPYVQALCLRVLPMFELCDDQHRLGIARELAVIKRKLNTPN